MSNLEAKYSPNRFESDIYDFTKQNKFFRKDQIDFSNPNNFIIILPPPNITGILHIGHALNGTIQDSVIRYWQLNNKNVAWIPGLDHAGISVQAKLESYLKKELGYNAFAKLSQDELLKYVWKWKQKYTNIIHEQWQLLGLSLDYNYETFTYSKSLQKIVSEVFVKMYNDKLIYQANKIVNWDCKLQTAISDIEVVHKPTKSNLYYVKYKVVSEKNNEYLVIATSRPETIFADVAIFVNPTDKRYQKYQNKVCINPCNGEQIPILSDEYVELDFGSAVMKCTPAHDINDFELAQKYNLPIKFCMDKAGKMINVPDKYKNMDRFECRKTVVDDLKRENKLIKIEPYENEIGYSERSNTIVEPYLSNQWFVRMKTLATSILNLQQNDTKKTTFIPERFDSTLRYWLTNIEDWCISRQIWWGHKFPVYYHKKTKEILVSATPPKNINEYVQDSNVLDTWFSSALWPLVCTKWFESENQKSELPQFITSLLVTAYDIIFFWVARMLMQTYYLTEKTAFKEVIIHGIVRDSQNRKMSKSLGNGVDPKELIAKYGTDTLRWFLISNTTAHGQDIAYNESKVKLSWAFLNKLWNASRYLFNAFGEMSDTEITLDGINYAKISELDKWLLVEWNQCFIKYKKNFEKYNFNLACQELSSFVWDKYCSIYLEFLKINSQNQANINSSIRIAKYVLYQLYLVMHPFCPLLTDYLYQTLIQNKNASLLTKKMPTTFNFNPLEFKDDARYIEHVMNILKLVRNFKTKNNVKAGLVLKGNIKLNNKNNDELSKMISTKLNEINNYFSKLANVTLNIDENLSDKNTYKIIYQNIIIEFSVSDIIDYQELVATLKTKKSKLEKEIERSLHILNNQKFLKNAKPEKVNFEKEKYKHYQQELELVIIELSKVKNEIKNQY
jgi:valyl-tRNA synthetase